MLVEVELERLGLGVDVEADVKEGHDGKAHVLLERPDVFEVGHAHGVAADDVVVVAGILGAGRGVRVGVAAHRVHAADVEALEDGDVLARVLEEPAEAAAHVDSVGVVEGVEALPVADDLDEVVGAAEAAAAPFAPYPGDGALGGPVPVVRGVAQDAGVDGARPVDALVVRDVGRGVARHVVEFVALQAVAYADRGVLADGIGEVEGVAHGFLGEVVPVVADVINVVAEGEVGVVDAGVGEGEHARGAAPGEEALQGEPVAAPEEVALHDGAGHAHVEVGGVAYAGHEGAGVALLDLDLQIDLVFPVGGHELRVHGGEVAQAVQALRGAAQLRALVGIAVAKAHFAEDDVVAGLGVALDDEAADEDLLLLVDHVDHVDRVRRVVGLDDARVHFGVGVALVVVVVLKLLGVFLHGGQREPVSLAGVHLDDLVHVLFGVDDVAGVLDAVDLVAGAFDDGEVDVDAVFLVGDLRRAHLDVDVALVEAVGGDGVGVALQVLLLEDAGTGEPGEDVALAQGHVLGHVALVQLLQAVDLDLGDVELLALVDGDDEDGAGTAGPVLDAVGRLGEIVAFLVVELSDLLEVVGKGLLVEHVALARGHGCQHVFRVHLVRAFDDDIVDAGLLHDVEDKDGALHAGLHVGEVAHLPDALDLFVDGVGVGLVAPAYGEAHQDNVGIHVLDAAHLHVGKGAGHRRAHGHELGAGISRRLRLGPGLGRRIGHGIAQGRRLGRLAQRPVRALGEFPGSLVKGVLGRTLEVRRHGRALAHGDKARLHGKALALLGVGAVDDEIGACGAAEHAGRFQIDGRLARRIEEASRLFHGNRIEPLGFELVDDVLGNLLRRVGHLHPGVHGKGKDQHGLSGCKAGSGQRQEKQRARAEDGGHLKQKSSHIAFPI